MHHALAAAKARGHGAVILLGDEPYYARFGFTADHTAELSLPGPFERERLLAIELRPGALNGANRHDRRNRRLCAGSEGSSRHDNAPRGLICRQNHGNPSGDSHPERADTRPPCRAA